MTNTEPGRVEPYCVHDYKVWPKFYEAIVSGAKTFEARIHDRKEHKPGIGCILRLQEAMQQTGALTGNVVERRVAYRLDGGEPPCAYLPSNFFIVGFDSVLSLREENRVLREKVEFARKAADEYAASVFREGRDLKVRAEKAEAERDSLRQKLAVAEASIDSARLESQHHLADLAKTREMLAKLQASSAERHLADLDALANMREELKELGIHRVRLIAENDALRSRAAYYAKTTERAESRLSAMAVAIHSLAVVVKAWGNLRAVSKDSAEFPILVEAMDRAVLSIPADALASLPAPESVPGEKPCKWCAGTGEEPGPVSRPCGGCGGKPVPRESGKEGK